MADRRSAKQVVEDFANEILRRPQSSQNDNMLAAIETISNRMSWKELYNKLRFRKEPVQPWYRRDDL